MFSSDIQCWLLLENQSMLFTMLTELIYIRVMQKKVSDNLSYPFLVKKQKTLSNRNRSGKSDRFSQAPKSLQMVTAAMKLKDTCSFKKSYDKPRQYIKKQRHHFANKGPYGQKYGFSSSRVWMWELNHKEGWASKKCFSIVLEMTLESPLDSKEIKPVDTTGNQPWIFIRRTDPEAEGPILWPLDPKSGLIGKDPDAGKDWRWEEKGTTEDEMVGWHHRLNGHEFEQTLADSVEQGSLACCSPWDCKESDMT